MLLALVPFAKGGTEHAAIEQMLLTLREQQQPEAFMIGASIATAMYKGHPTDLEWLQERMKKLFDEDLQNNPFYQSIVEEGVVKGRLEGRLETINLLFLPMVRKRFPELVTLVQERVDTIDDLPHLFNLVLKLMDAQTSSEARAILQEH